MNKREIIAFLKHNGFILKCEYAQKIKVTGGNYGSYRDGINDLIKKLSDEYDNEMEEKK